MDYEEINMDFLEATVDGKPVQIPLGLNRPFIDDFENFEDWLHKEREFAKSIVRRMEAGEVLCQRSIEEEMEGWSMRAQQMLKSSSVLRVERTMLYIDMHIRSCLSPEDPDLLESVRMLAWLKTLPLTPLMLKKNPHVVETVDKATTYVNFFQSDQKTRSKWVDVAKKVEEVKKHGSAVMRKFRQLFEVPDEKSFAEVFTQQLQKFNEHIHDMAMYEISFMTEEPQEWSENKVAQ